MLSSRKRVRQKIQQDHKTKEELADLLVFGYECKVFQEDEKAAYIEDGHHLIPWMGDSSLMIDRSVCLGDFRRWNFNLPAKGFDL